VKTPGACFEQAPGESQAEQAMSEFYRIVVGILCVWRITHLFQAEDGPFDVIVHIRKAAADTFWGRLLDCFYCLSLWVSLPLGWLLGQTLIERALLWPALSAGAILLERLSSRTGLQPTAHFMEDKED
jgi:hypothetical protein